MPTCGIECTCESRRHLVPRKTPPRLVSRSDMIATPNDIYPRIPTSFDNNLRLPLPRMDPHNPEYVACGVRVSQPFWCGRPGWWYLCQVPCKVGGDTPSRYKPPGIPTHTMLAENNVTGCVCKGDSRFSHTGGLAQSTLRERTSTRRRTFELG